VKVLILGGTGLVGSNLVKVLSKANTVDYTSRSGKNESLLFNISKPETFVICNNNYDVIINCIVDYTSEIETRLQQDILDKFNLLEFVSTHTSHYIDVSSISALEENKLNSDYNFSKYLAEQVTVYCARKFKFNYSILRYAQVFDQEEKARVVQKGLYYFVDSFRNQTVLNVLGDADFKRSYIPVEILCKTIEYAMQNSIYGPHNVIMPELFSSKDLIKIFSNQKLLNEEKIIFKPAEPSTQYFVPPCSTYFNEFMIRSNSVVPYFIKLLQK